MVQVRSTDVPSWWGSDLEETLRTVGILPESDKNSRVNARGNHYPTIRHSQKFGDI